MEKKEEQEGGRRRGTRRGKGKGSRKGRSQKAKGKGTRKGTPWTRFVKKIYDEMKRKDKNVKLGAAMKEASKRKSEMKE
jgi:hypothetical protein